MKKILRYILLVITLTSVGLAQQLSIPRIDQMPNMPSPYAMRNWKQVALGYDSLVFNFGLTGEFLPTVWLNTNPINYPGQNSFGLSTVVGTTVPTSAEAINCIPAVVSATLVGVNKANQNGYNWPLMCEEWFNKRPEQNVYKNHPEDDTGDDWWYETMPNVFFYELNSQYPGMGDFNNQDTVIANRWLQAVQAMGASGTPWQVPYMDHRGWYLQNMTPYDQSVHEPEAAGAIADILYDTYVLTGNPKYRIGAEWSMEFLNNLTSNPSYELQLSYGTYLAARMNAEIGTTYDVEKMVNWCFDVGPLRSWGAMTGTWGAYDCDGLIGEVNGSNNYAFSMNTFEQIGELVPLVRYDSRFAREIGKWVLNAANAARLFYPASLPSTNQDSSYRWSHQYDPNSYIAHEALRQSNGSASPYATGDAISGGWGLTTLTLYSSSHVGILGGIIDTTNVPMILRLDVLKTDYYHATAYPSYLYYNPYAASQSISFDAGSGSHDIYDAASHQFIQHTVSGTVSLPIPANSALLVVLTPSGGTVTYDLDKTLVNGVAVDFHSGRTIANYPPRIKSLMATSVVTLRSDTVAVYCTATDLNNDSLTYSWRSSHGTIVGAGSSIRWVAPSTAELDSVTCVVSDGHGGFDSAHVAINVLASINLLPVINKLTALPRKLNLGATTTVACSVSDSDGDNLTVHWSSLVGTINATDTVASWTLPDSSGNYYITCTISDGHGGVAVDSIGVEVRDLSQHQSGALMAYYPFNGSAADASGNGNNGTVYGAQPTLDRFGHLNYAYAFDGATNYIDVPNSTNLNFQQYISVNFWMYISQFYSREQYPVSHGSWQNRWKVSISNNHIRWTVKTITGVKDLDSETLPQLYTWYNVTAIYNGSDMELWLNGDLDAFTTMSGSILTTSDDLLIGQDLPGDQNYNFHGSLDELRIYNYGLSPEAVDTLAGLTGAKNAKNLTVPTRYFLRQNYPNPFNPSTTIEYGLPERADVSLRIYDVLGRQVATLFAGTQSAGYKSIVWNSNSFPSGVYFYQLKTPTSLQMKKLVLLK